MTQKFFRAFGCCLLTLLAFHSYSHAYTITGDLESAFSPSWWAQAVQADQAKSPEPLITGRLRDPGVAIALATFPGVAIHGSGHFYAGRPVTAAQLLLVEAGAVVMSYRGISDLISIIETNSEDGRSEIEIIENLEDSGQLSRAVGLAAGGVVLFISSWLYDLTGSPLAVLEDNEKKKNQTRSSGPSINAKLTLTGFELKVDQLF